MNFSSTLPSPNTPSSDFTTLDTFIEAYRKRTAGSQRFADEHRATHVDKSSIGLGGSGQTSTLAYPIVIDRAEGARLWDIDGNQYVDILQGLGANLFGHNPDFVRQAIAERLQTGFPIGVQTKLVGEVAQQLVRLTGMPRILFSNTGTEAIMTAIRVARAKTRRAKIAVFTDSYHGHTDTVLMRAPIAEYARKKLVRSLSNRRWWSPLASLFQGKLIAGSAPASAGIPRSVARDVIVLEYGNSKSLEIIKSNQAQLAAVLVEPVQSRKPELQPRDFLQQLREVTRQYGIGLIFDEMVTGFRIHPGGAQAHFQVDADLATYGKIVGGGLPLSVLAGRDEFMDALQPRKKEPREKNARRDKTAFFAGTYCKHPLSLVAARATLSQIISAGPSLQVQLNQRVETLANRLNAFTAEKQIPIQFTHFGSGFGIALSQSKTTPDEIHLLSHYFIHQGIFLRAGDRGGFLTTAHSEEDIEQIYRAFCSGMQLLKRTKEK